ncbi:hypothetical protein Tco_1401931 [Tanacetum coccineum]
MVTRTVLTRSGPISLNTARPVNTVQQKTTVNNAGPMKNVINNAYSTARRPFKKITMANNSNFNKRVNTVNDKNVNAARPNAVVNTARPKAVLSDIMGNKENAVKASTCWGNPHHDLKDKGVIDSGCSKHMTGNRSYLTDYEEINGGFVAFRGNSKGGKITGKCKIRTGKLDFEDVYWLISLGSELGSELTFLAGGELKTSKLDTSEYRIGRQNRGQGNNTRGASAAGYGGAQNRVRNAIPGQARQIKCYNCNGGQDNAIDEDVDEQPVQDLALNVDNVFQAEDCDVFNFDVDKAPTAQTMFMANLSSAYPYLSLYNRSVLMIPTFYLSTRPMHSLSGCVSWPKSEEHELHADVHPNYVVAECARSIR